MKKYGTKSEILLDQKLISQTAMMKSKTLILHTMVINVRSVFHQGSKYYPQVFLEECLYKIRI